MDKKKWQEKKRKKRSNRSIQGIENQIWKSHQCGFPNNRASTSYFFPTFSYFFLFFQNLPIYSYFCSEIPIFSYFFTHLVENKTYRYLHFCSYMTIGATVEKCLPPTGASILNLHSVHIIVHLNIGLTHKRMHPSIPTSSMKHNICMYEKHICYPEMI